MPMSNEEILRSVANLARTWGRAKGIKTDREIVEAIRDFAGVKEAKLVHEGFQAKRRFRKRRSS